MQKSELRCRFSLLIVGTADDDFVRYVEDLAGRLACEFRLCSNIYSACAMLGEIAGKCGICIGRFEDLSREGGRFFEMVRRKGILCCCLAEADSVFRRKGVSQATRAGALMIQRPADLDKIISRVLTRQVSSAIEAGSAESLDMLKDEFSITAEELTGHHGVECDEQYESGK